MIEKVILNHLMEKLNMTDVYPEVPRDNIPAEFVVIDKTGGGEANQIWNSQVAVQSYGPTLLDAAALNVRVKAAMKTLTIHPDVSRCHLETEYNFTDTETKRYRYQAVYDITHYE